MGGRKTQPPNVLFRKSPQSKKKEKCDVRKKENTRSRPKMDGRKKGQEGEKWPTEREKKKKRKGGGRTKKGNFEGEARKCFRGHQIN